MRPPKLVPFGMCDTNCLCVCVCVCVCSKICVRANLWFLTFDRIRCEIHPERLLAFLPVQC